MSKYLRAHGKPWIERVLTPSLSIIYPRTQNLEKGFFLYFFPFRLDEIKVGGDSCLPRHFANKNANQHQTVSSATVSQNWRLCWGIYKWGIP